MTGSALHRPLKSDMRTAAAARFGSPPAYATLVVPSLQAGGAERVASTLANYWAAHGKTIHVITVEGQESDFYALHGDVVRHTLNASSQSGNAWHGVRQNAMRISRLRDAVRSSGAPCVVSFVERTNVLAAFASVGLRKRLVLAERTDPRAHMIGTLWNRLRRVAYRMADIVVVQTRSVREWAVEFLPEERVKVIPNPVNARVAEPPVKWDDRKPSIVAMGRFTREKGFDILLRGFAAVAPSFHEWNLVILGDGPLRGELTALITELGIDNRVLLAGIVRDPERYLRSAQVFVLPSRFEGFPNALLEAMASGCAVIATDCPSGPRYIVRSDENGILVAPDSPEALANGLDRMLQDSHLRRKLGTAATAVLTDFGLEKIMNLWEQVIDGGNG